MNNLHTYLTIKSAGILSDYNPIDIYNQKKREHLAKIVKPTYSNANAKRMEQEYIDKQNRLNSAVAGIAGMPLGALLACKGYDRLFGEKMLNHELLDTVGTTAAGLSGVAAGFHLPGKVVPWFNRVTGRSKKTGLIGYNEGAKLDSLEHQKAMKQYEEALANAEKEFNIKYTGMEEPGIKERLKGGIKLYNEK